MWKGKREMLPGRKPAQGGPVLPSRALPGFILDTPVIALTEACLEVHSIEASRADDLAPFGRSVMRSRGVGTTPGGFAGGTIIGHVGFPRSIRVVADALGWHVERVVVEGEAVISSTFSETHRDARRLGGMAHRIIAVGGSTMGHRYSSRNVKGEGHRRSQ